MEILTNIYDLISDKNLSIILFFIPGYFFGSLLASFFFNNIFVISLIGLIVGIIFAVISRLIYEVISANLRILFNLVSLVIFLVALTLFIKYASVNLFKNKDCNSFVIPNGNILNTNPDIIDLDLTDIKPEKIKIDLE